MRIVKEAAERKNEILDAANELFGQRGFDGTSTNDILERVGIARGTLYYHFKSKEEIMNALIERIGSRIVEAAQRIASDKSIPVYERIIRVALSLNISDGSGKELVEQMHNPQNALMHQKTQKMMIANITPILAGIIREGIEQGLFTTPYPYESMEMILVYANTIFDDDDMVEMTEGERIIRIQAFTFNMERLLGAESGSLVHYMIRIFDDGDDNGLDNGLESTNGT